MDKQTVLDLIQKYEKKIETYRAVIAELQAELGGPSLAVPAGASEVKKNQGGDPLGHVQHYQFFNKTQAEAARLILEKVGYPLKTDVLLAGVEKGGLTIGGKTEKDKKQNFYTILRRGDDFVRVARDTWALSSWPGVPKKSAKENGQENEQDEVKEETETASE